uniref:Ribonuclease P protein subunit p20 n=1 Tax=Romanomermis culicivorax TaxID=13658 RepID=A0A915JND2_ROMCU
MDEIAVQSSSSKSYRQKRNSPAFIDSTTTEDYELRKRLPPRFPTRKNDIYVTKRTNFRAQLERCRKLLDDKAFDQIFVHGLGAAVNRALNLALQLKRQSVGTLEMELNTSTIEVTDDLYPLLDDLEFRQRIRNVSAVHIRLFVPRKPVENY